ncbi:MAG: hypothetical protein WC294_00130 [Methanoregula sp.]|jgi:hypothetical protein
MALEDSEKRDLEEKEKDQDFEDAFAQAESVGERAELSPADDPANTKDQAEIDAEAARAAEEAERVAAQTETDRLAAEQAEAAKETEKKPEDEEAYEQRWKSLQGIVKKKDDDLKTAQEAWEAEKAALLAQVEEAKKPAEKKEEKKETTEEELTDEQKEALEEYERDFDVVSKMEGKKREKELTKLRKEFEEKLESISAQLAPIKGVTEFVATTQKKEEIQSEEAHFKAIDDAHPGWEQYRDDGSVLKWIESKPKYLQKAFLETYQKGTAEDIVTLLQDFKTENNIQPSKPDNVVNLQEKKEEKRKALSAVDTSRRAVNPNMKVADDFEGAFEEAMRK